MALQYGLIVINGTEGFYYTPPDGITKCLMYSSNGVDKYELQTLLANSINVVYRELISSNIEYKLALFRYETDNVPINIEDHSFTIERLYTHKSVNELYKKEWLNFFQRSTITDLIC